MQALVGFPSLSLTERPLPVPAPGEALVRVRVAGICNTDLEIVRGYMGFTGVLGHEFVGEVVQCDASEWVGRRVCGEINVGCGTCSECCRGLGRHCPTRSVLGILNKDGCFAHYVTLPVGNLHEVPATVSDAAAVFVEPLAAAFEVLEQVHVQPADRVLVLGDGKLGLLVAMVLRLTGCDLVVAGRHARKLALVGALGARVVRPEDLSERDFDVVIEATGSPDGLGMALERVRPRGSIVLKSTYQGAPNVDTARLVIDEITLLGSRCGPFAAALRALEHGRVDPSPLVDTTLPLSQGLEALSRAQQPGALKVLLDMA